jgi:hypothetical protein
VRRELRDRREPRRLQQLVACTWTARRCVRTLPACCESQHKLMRRLSDHLEHHHAGHGVDYIVLDLAA